jgi:outer membrane protein assembly factor BamB
MRWQHALAALLVFVATSFAEDWPQWLGPRRDNSTTETVTPWKEPLKVVWRKPVGEGNSAPVVAGGLVYMHAKVAGKNAEEIVAFDAASGEEKWRTSYDCPEFKSLFGNGPRGTPAVANGKLYAFGITGILTCLDAASGKQLWQIDAIDKFQARRPLFGMSCSPLVEDNKVLVNVGAKGASVVAFDVNSGAVVWQKLDDGASYSSPIVFGKDKDRQVVFFTQEGLESLNPHSGDVFWKFPLRDTLFESSTTPIRAGDILLASSITYGSAGLRLEEKDGKPAYESAWKNPALTSYFSTPVPVGKDHIYIVTGTKPNLFGGGGRTPNVATLHCIEAATGKILWKRPNVGRYHASLMRTGNDKVLMLDEDGFLVLIEPSAEKYQELARSKACGETWAHPAIANGKVYVRDHKEVICLGLNN